MLDRLHTNLTLLGVRTRTDFFIHPKFFSHVVSLSTSKVSPGFANTDKLTMNDSSHNYKELDEYPEDAIDEFTGSLSLEYLSLSDHAFVFTFTKQKIFRGPLVCKLHGDLLVYSKS